MSGLVYDVPEAQYHADPALSQSGAKLLLDCPAKYRHRMDTGPQVKDEFDFGHAAHAKVLGVGLDVVVIDADDWRTKAAQEAKAAAHADGKTPLLAKDAEKVDAMATALENHAGARAILTRPGEAEVSMWWTEHSELYDADVPCRGRIDWLTTTLDGRPVVLDYKTTVDASPAAFAKNVANYRYDMQAVAYRRGHEAVTGTDSLFILLVQEKWPPYLPALYVLDWQFEDRGTRAWERAIDLYAACTATGEWPGHPTDITELSPPRWATYEETSVV